MRSVVGRPSFSLGENPIRVGLEDVKELLRGDLVTHELLPWNERSIHHLASSRVHAAKVHQSGLDIGDRLIARLQRIAGLKVVHSWEASRRNTGNVPATAEEIADSPPVTHPLVRTHPDTGRKVLYMGTHTSHIEGMEYEEGRALLRELLEFAEQPQFVFNHQWRPGDVVMWDNRTLLHRAVRKYDMKLEKRLLHRTVVKGTVPV